MDISYQYKVTVDDYIDYYNILIYEIRGNKLINKLSLLLVVCFIWFLYVLIKPYKLVIILFSIFVLIVLMIILFIPLTTQALAKRAYNKNPYIKYINEYKIDNNSICIRTGSNNSEIKWSMLKGYYESKKNIYCLFYHNQVLIIPKNLVDVQDVISFLNASLSHINTKK